MIEVMGGIEPAKTYIIEALEAGKQIVTANKDLLAEHGQEVMAAAEKPVRTLNLKRQLPVRFRLSVR